ncbi:hypothetical protein TELCIR_17945, partial [Teladorsagia circumcincta]
SSCQDTVARCEAAEECRWHLGELRVRCAPNTCRRTDCAADRRLNQAGAPVGHRGVTRPGTSGEYPDTRRTDYGQTRQSWSRNESGSHREGYRAGSWKEKEARKGDWSGGAGDGQEQVHLSRTGWQDEGEAESYQRGSAKGRESVSAGRHGSSKWTTSATPIWPSTRRKTTEYTEGRRREKPRTTLSPMPTEPPPPWETTTTQPPTTTGTLIGRDGAHHGVNVSLKTNWYVKDYRVWKTENAKHLWLLL